MGPLCVVSLDDCKRTSILNVTINAISAKLGGSVTYLQNVLPYLRDRLPADSDRLVVWRGDAKTGVASWPQGIEYREDALASGGIGAIPGTWRRLWFDQVRLPRMLRREHTDVLFSSANFGPLRCPCRHVLLVRNSAYFDRVYMSRMRSPRVRAYLRFQRWLTLRVMKTADMVFFPTRAMLELVAQHTGGERANWRVAHYGLRQDLFTPKSLITPPEVPPLTLLNVSLYSDQKDFGTLLRATRLLNERRPNRFHLKVTAGFSQDWLGQSAFHPRFSAEKSLYQQLEAEGIAEDVGWKSYGQLPELYRAAAIFVFPSYTESFGHPLLEAMASGLPIVAADTPVNRELCGRAAVYFPPFDADACATSIESLSDDAASQQALVSHAMAQIRKFSWTTHAAQLVDAFSDTRDASAPFSVEPT